MKKQIVQLNEAQLQQIIRETVAQCLNESVDEFNLRNTINNFKDAWNSGKNTFSSKQQMDNMPDKYNPWDNDEIENVFNQLNAREHQLQVQLNQIRNKKSALMKQYGVKKGKGNLSPVSRNAMSVHTTGAGLRGNAQNKATANNVAASERIGL